MERIFKRYKSVKALYMKTKVLASPRSTPILEGRCRMHGPMNELDDSSDSKERSEEIVLNDASGKEEHDPEDKFHQIGDGGKDLLATISDSAGKQQIVESGGTLVTSTSEDEKDEPVPRKSDNDLHAENDLVADNKKTSGRRGRSKRTFLRDDSTKNPDSLEVSKQSADLYVQLIKEEASSSNLVIQLCSGEAQSPHVEMQASHLVGLESDGLSLSPHLTTMAPGISNPVGVVKPVSSSLLKSGCQTPRSDILAISSNSTEACTKLQISNLSRTSAEEIRCIDSKMDEARPPCQTFPEQYDSIPNVGCAENRPVNALNNELDKSNTTDADGTDCSRIIKLNEVPEDVEQELSGYHAQNFASSRPQGTSRSDKGETTENVQCRSRMETESTQGNSQRTILPVKLEKSDLKGIEAFDVDSCKTTSDALLHQQSAELNASRVLPGGESDFMHAEPVQLARQESKSVDVATGTSTGDTPNDSHLDRKTSSFESIKAEAGAPDLPQLEVFLGSSKSKQLEDSSFYSAITNMKVAELSGAHAYLASAVQSDHCGLQNEKKSVDSREEIESKLRFEPVDEAKIYTLSQEQESLTSRGCKETSPSTLLSEEDVKVCDICGDAGYEDSLAICSTCSEGAEHIYCMRTRLMEVPKGNWSCETCNDKQKADVSDSKLSDSETIVQRTAESTHRKNPLKRKYSLLSTQHRKDRLDDGGAKVASSSLSRGDYLARPVVANVGGAAPLHKQVLETVDQPHSTGKGAAPQENMLKGKESGKIKSPSYTGGEHMKNPLPPSNDLSALKRQDSRSNISRETSSTMEAINVPSKLGKRKQLVPPLTSPDMVVPPLKRQASKISGPLQANFPLMARPEKTSKPAVKGLEPIRTKLPSLPAQGFGLYGGPEINSNVQLKGRLENDASLFVTADPRGLSAPSFTAAKDATLTSLPRKPGNVSQEKIRLTGDVSDAGGPLLDSKDDIGTSNQVSKAAVDGGSSRSQPLVEAPSRTVSFSKTKSSSAISKEAIGARDFQAEEGEARPVSRDSPLSTSFLPAISTHADVRDNSTVSRAVSILAAPGATRCYRCKETGHSAKDCSRNLSSQTVVDLRQAGSRAPTLVNGSVDGQWSDPKFLQGNRGGHIQVGSILSSCEGPVLSDFARPLPNVLWRGEFEVVEEGRSSIYDGIQAHPSNKAVKEVYEASMLLPSRLRLEEVQAQFQPNPPDGGLIALYFKAMNADSATAYRKLLDHMTKNDLVLRGLTTTAELLVFTSDILPRIEQCWNGEKFLWGLFRKRKLSAAKSGVIPSTWSHQNSIPLTGPMAREASESYPSNFNSTVPLEQTFSAYLMDVNTVPLKNLDTAVGNFIKSRETYLQRVPSSSSMTVFPYAQEGQQMVVPSTNTLQLREPNLSQGLLQAEHIQCFPKEVPLMANSSLIDSYGGVNKSPVASELEMANAGLSPDHQNAAGISSRLKAGLISSTEKGNEKEPPASGSEIMLTNTPLSGIEANEQYLSHPSHSFLLKRQTNDVWDDSRPHTPYVAGITLSWPSRSRSMASEQQGSREQETLILSRQQSSKPNVGQARSSVQLAETQDGKTFSRLSTKSRLNAESNQREDSNVRVINERELYGDACKDDFCFTKQELLLRSLASNSQNRLSPSSAGRSDPRSDLKESTHSENDSAESSISSGEPFNEQKLSMDASAASYPLASGEVDSVQPEACTSLNLELGLRSDDVNSPELRLIEKLSGFHPTQQSSPVKSKLAHADYLKGKSKFSGNEAQNFCHSGLVDPSLSLTLAAPIHRQENLFGSASEDGTHVDIAECPLQLFK